MRTPLKAAVAAAAITGAGLAGFGFTNVLAQTDDTAPDPSAQEAPAPESDRPEDCEGRGHHGPPLEALAEVIGIDVDELRTALRDGQTPAEVAEANGVSRDELVDAIVADIGEHLDQAVEDGRLTEEEADERRADAQERAEALADGERPERGPGGPGRGGPGRGGPPPAAEDDAPADA